jgi:YidC/Oxa1 family membrane protein insertase
MDKRIITLMIFIFSGLMLWEAWQKQVNPPKPPVAASADAKTGVAAVPALPGATATGATAMPTQDAVPQGERITVRTDKLLAEIDTAGGGLRKLTLLQHFAADQTDKPLVLMQDSGAPFYITQSGLLGKDLPNHNTRYTAEAKDYTLEAGKDTLEVKLSAPDANGVKVSKRFTFRRDSYEIDESYDIVNGGSDALTPSAYFQFLRDGTPPPGNQRFVSTFTGPAIYTDKSKFHKIDFSDIDKGKASVPIKSSDGWVALVQHYFVAAWLPKAGGELEFYTKKVNDKFYSAGVVVGGAPIAAGATGSVSSRLYAGPQEVDKLEKIAPGLGLTIDYGWLTIVAAPLFWLLSKIHDFVGNWGVAIILLTVLIKAAFYGLQAKSYKSMAQMKVLAPKVEKLKQQYGDDRNKLNTAMMELYRTEKINPLGGCLPVLVQMPVFIALYWILLGSVELRHAPFALWIKDLSAPDPFYVLPVLYGISMYITTKMSPAPADPIQAKMMTIMPLVFGIFFFFFPAGLVLYWVVSNTLSIAQQWSIARTHGDKAIAVKKLKR